MTGTTHRLSSGSSAPHELADSRRIFLKVHWRSAQPDAACAFAFDEKYQFRFRGLHVVVDMVGRAVCTREGRSGLTPGMLQ